MNPALTLADTLGLTPKDGCDLALSAFGAVIWLAKYHYVLYLLIYHGIAVFLLIGCRYLTSSLMDYELLSMGKFERYSPLDSAQPAVAMPQFTLKKMVCDFLLHSDQNLQDNY